METTRQKKVARLVLKELSQIFNKETTNLIGPMMISITAVRISPDLAYANIYVSIFPVDDPLESLNQIKNNSSFFRKKLGSAVRNQLRIVPELNFFLDDSAESDHKIIEIFYQRRDFMDFGISG